MNKGPTAVSIDQQARFVVGGEPFFPIGLYSVPHEESFAELRRAGFNVVHSYEFSRTLYLNPQSRERAIKEFDGLGDAAAAQYLKTAADHDLLVLMTFNRPQGSSQEVFSAKGREQMSQRIVALREQPALLAWYVADEPDGQEFAPEWVCENRQLAESLDTAHPTMSCLCVPSRFGEYAQTSEVLMYDPYPVCREPLSVVGGNHTRLKKIVGPARATIGVIQAFDWRSYSWMHLDTRPPTLQELRCMTYQAIVGGVSGVFYFCYDNELHSNRAAANPEGWLSLAAVAHELQTLMPALLAPPSRSVGWEGEIQACARVVGEETWVLAVNPNAESCEATFTLPAEAAKATVLNCFDSPAHLAVQDSWRMDFEPYGVRALRVRSA